MNLRRFRFRTKHLLAVTALIAGIIAAPSLLWSSQASIQINELRDDMGSQLWVSYSSEFDSGCCGGCIYIPRRVDSDRLAELVGRQWSTSYRPRDFLWLKANHHDVIEREIASAVDEIVANH